MCIKHDLRTKTAKTETDLNECKPAEAKGRLVATARAAAPRRPVDDDEAQTHYHKQAAHSSKAGSLGDTEIVSEIVLSGHCLITAMFF